MKRHNDRKNSDIRPVTITPHFLDYADGSALIEMGQTKVLTAATIDEKVPHFLKGSGKGWVTAEYSMLPRSTQKRNIRERIQGRISGRNQEIQRLIGRSLRAVTDMSIFGERTVILDCDVMQADGGTRSASITCGCISLALAFNKMIEEGIIDVMPLKNLVAAISLGIVEERKLLDLDYSEDSTAKIDMNVVGTDTGEIVEVQASAEKAPFTRNDLMEMLHMAEKGLVKLIGIQKDVLKEESMLFMAYAQNDRPG
jgi:ribonuclease PH